MFALRVRLSWKSVSGALLVLGGTPGLANAASCDRITCLVSPQANVLIDDGSSFHVGTGGVLSDSTVSNGVIDLRDSGAAQGTHVIGDGWLMAQDSSTAFDSVVKSGGTMVIVGSATALSTRVDGGDFEVAQNAVVSDTQLDAGRMYLYMDATAKNTRIGNAEMTVYQNGNARQTTVDNGGVLSVLDSASASDTVVNQGARMDIAAGTSVRMTTVNTGGVMVLADRAGASETTINQGGLLQLKGDATLGQTSHIDGQVNFAGPEISGFHVLTFEGPLSGNGSFLMNTDLAALQGDLIRVQGPLSDTHTLIVADSGRAPSSALQKLMLVDGNGGSGNFTLYGQTVDAGAYRYQLHQQGNDWYLANLAEIDPVTPPVEPPVQPPVLPPVEPPVQPPVLPPVEPPVQPPVLPPVEPPVQPPVQPPVEPPVQPPVQPPVEPPVQPPVEPVFPVNPAEPISPVQPPRLPQSEVLSKGANAAVANQTAGAALISAQMSATTGHFGDLRSGKDKGGLWTRGYGTEQRLDTGASRAFQQQVNGLEIGADKALPLSDGTLYVGGLIGQGQGHQDFGEASKSSIDSTTIGAYASYLDHSGLYLDGALKYSRLDNDIDITSNLGEPVKAHYRNHAVSADVQVGKAIDLGQGWFVEPQAGLQAARISGGRYTASNGLDVEQDSMKSLQSHVGGLFGREVQLDNGIAIKPYAKAAWITEHAGDSHVKVNGAKLDSRLPGSRAEIGGGMRVSMAGQHSLIVEAGYTNGSDIEQPWAATVGYRYSW
ncbi:autotransporter outer membrane beta-barrel domain-containing protein [Pseudomonas sp. PDM32]|uniref:autotransporter outer membrane beta-barrel domain-containing protein n=1 Tax=Pseudomonas sp. PDM32 TaxID=2854768 RepID=UPI001C4678D9|nr:autotransporter outer membrane beta-barrel domain-containing protein [Pseudomonas sp. PDM32]MBV7575439.1 autotransporter outer membrane beta-barrel domain-containing protein [Pseudomonas sp. PDM32]